jgi:hypothetical protein
MEEMKWFSSAILGVGVLAVNKPGFGLALAEIYQTSGMWLCQGHMACPRSATQSPLDIATSLMNPYGGNEMVQQCHAWCWCAGCKHLGFGLAL